jgi:hypothetical protein
MAVSSGAACALVDFESRARQRFGTESINIVNGHPLPDGRDLHNGAPSARQPTANVIRAERVRGTKSAGAIVLNCAIG